MNNQLLYKANTSLLVEHILAGVTQPDAIGSLWQLDPADLLTLLTSRYQLENTQKFFEQVKPGITAPPEGMPESLSPFNMLVSSARALKDSLDQNSPGQLTLLIQFFGAMGDFLVKKTTDDEQSLISQGKVMKAMAGMLAVLASNKNTTMFERFTAGLDTLNDAELAKIVTYALELGDLGQELPLKVILDKVKPISIENLLRSIELSVNSYALRNSTLDIEEVYIRVLNFFAEQLKQLTMEVQPRRGSPFLNTVTTYNVHTLGDIYLAYLEGDFATHYTYLLDTFAPNGPYMPVSRALIHMCLHWDKALFIDKAVPSQGLELNSDAIYWLEGAKRGLAQAAAEGLDITFDDMVSVLQIIFKQLALNIDYTAEALEAYIAANDPNRDRKTDVALQAEQERLLSLLLNKTEA